MMAQQQIVTPAYRRCHVHVVVMFQMGIRPKGKKEMCFVSHI
jgi:hypothetical protein